MSEQVASAIVYGVIPPRFGSPPLQAVADRLPYLAGLGINAVWLSPIAACPPGEFGYGVVDELAVRRDYGDEDDLRALVRRAHAEGLRVLLDLVPNHTSHLHPFFTDGEHDDWYDRDADGQPTHYFNWTHLPNLNYDNPDVRAYMNRVFTHWVSEFDVDGFRVDACWGVQYRRPEYWPAWSRMLRELKPGLLLIAEASARDEYWYESGYDVAYDWTDDLGKWAWEQVFDGRAEIAARLDRALAADPRPERVFRFLDNNDTGPRFVTRYGPLLTRAAAALVLTLPGIPCVYTGEEVGAEYEPYGEAGVVDWEADPHGLREWYRALCRLRASRPALRGAAWARVEIAPDRGDCYAYVRGEPGPEAALVLLNFGDDEARMQVTLPDGFEALARASALVDVLGDEEVSGPAAGISVPPGSARVLEERR
ncbi:MAG TPA: alpha-amylase family glycosyl hydrolase [Gaiellales bacterium]|nr:alpha-amylase family glycosyl hydrolase [Gaiellales bacterium]